jgi:hypothetical protein
MNILILNIPSAIFLLSLLFPLTAIFWFRHTNKKHRTPLTQDLLRGPGDSIRKVIQDVDDSINTYLMMTLVLPVTCYAVYITDRYAAKAHAHGVVYVLLAVLPLMYFTFKLAQNLKQRNALRLGLDCEIAVGQELNRLMLGGHYVYHDFLADNFNIDHVVVGPNGVFAVETKGRAKSEKNRETEDVKVFFDGEALKFPDWTERNYLPQARRQAEWLANWLSSAVGEKIPVKPVLVITGWYVTSSKPCDVLLASGKNIHISIPKQRENSLTAEQITRIAHQLEQKCRNMEPLAFKKTS